VKSKNAIIKTKKILKCLLVLDWKHISERFSFGHSSMTDRLKCIF
jgi:hypothetical protein